jgi:thiol-disulfide isomerase/thioredoxin
LTASASAASAGLSASGAGLPDLELPCFTGGQPVRLTELRGPAVVNLWASWCGPCRDELPVMQRLADRAGGRLHVLGVDVGDGRDAAASFGAGRQVTMPTLYDRDRRLLSALGRVNLPVTIFVDSAGRDYVHPMPVDAVQLSELVRRHTGVTVPL